jgi:hypothetical protein
MPATKSIDSKRLSDPWPNMFIFPKQLREMIPDYGPRALVVDEVTGAPNYGIESGYGPSGTRALVQFVVHETGNLDGKAPVYLDVDVSTLRSLGQFLMDLAQQIEGPAV